MQPNDVVELQELFIEYISKAKVFYKNDPAGASMMVVHKNTRTHVWATSLYS